MLTLSTYKRLLKHFNERLETEVASSESRLDQAARYVLEGAGKRIRPMLLMATALDLGVREEVLFAPAIALELLHNYSLIHDDLPCMDDDKVRRGKPTLHLAFDEATAVLTGDYLLTESFGQILHAKHLNASQKELCLKVLHHYASGSELLQGQSLDLQQLPELGTFQDLKEIYQKKTASLLCCALKMASILAQVEPAEEKRLTQVGLALGLAFQIENDFKGQKKDHDQGKFTIFSLCNEQQAKALKNRFIEDAKLKLAQSAHTFTHLMQWIQEVFGDEVHSS